MSMKTLFTKIFKGELPSVTLYKDDICFVILDINPVVKGHALVISNKPYSNMANCPNEVLAHMMKVAKLIDARQREALGSQGSNIMINNDPASGQEVPHIHVHVIPRFEGDGRKLFTLHDKYEENEMAQYGEKLKITEL